MALNTLFSSYNDRAIANVAAFKARDKVVVEKLVLEAQLAESKTRAANMAEKIAGFEKRSIDVTVEASHLKAKEAQATMKAIQAALKVAEVTAKVEELEADKAGLSKARDFVVGPIFKAGVETLQFAFSREGFKKALS